MSEDRERKKTVIHQSWGVMTEPYERHGFRPQEDAQKLEELKKVMGEKPKDRRLLTRYLIAREAGLVQLRLKEKLDEMGLQDVRKADGVLIDEYRKRIKDILRVGK